MLKGRICSLNHHVIVRDPTATFWLSRAMEHNHEILALQQELDRARLQARRAESNRMPDPTLGVHLANEQGGNDKIIGVSLSIRWPGNGREAQVRMHQAQADALAERIEGVRRRLSAEILANWQRAIAGVESWQRMEEAAQAASRRAALTRRAHELGEMGLSDTLLAQRDAIETRLAADLARLNANEAIARLMLDAHMLWPLDEAQIVRDLTTIE